MEDDESVHFSEVPEGCIAAIAALTTPRDACTLAAVSREFSSAADSDVVWERFLPSDCEAIVARSEDGGEALLPEIGCKKELFVRLANRPLLVDGKSKSFWLEKSCGKKCWMLSARSLTIIWSCTPRYWAWTSTPESRFSEVAELMSVCWLDIRGKIKTSMLSPDTRYAAYLVFNTTEEAYGLNVLSEAMVRSTAGGKTETQLVYLTAEREQLQRLWLPSRGVARGVNRPRLPFVDTRVSRLEADQYPKPRRDGWQELKIGELLSNAGEEDDEIELAVMEVKGGHWKGGLVVEGIEVRPVEGRQ